MLADGVCFVSLDVMEDKVVWDEVPVEVCPAVVVVPSVDLSAEVV